MKAIADPGNHGRRFLAAYLDKLTGTWAAGFVLQQHKPGGKWGTTTYSLKVTDQEAVGARIKAKQEAESQRPEAL